MPTKKLLAAALVTGSLFMSGGALATVLTLNPSATNGGAGTLDAGTVAFDADNISGSLYSLIDITSTGVGGHAGQNASVTESGVIPLRIFDLGGIAQASNVDRATGTGTYDIYAAFNFSGVGTWLSDNLLVVGGVNSLSVTLWGSPTLGSTPAFGAPTTTADGLSGSLQGDMDFILATGSLVVGATNNGLVAIGNGASGSAATTLSSLIDFTPAAGTTGVGGFFEAPDPFNINFGTSSGSNNNQSTFTDVGNFTQVTTPGSQPGTANLTPIAQVPEPGVLGLLGLGMFGLAISSARKRKVAVPV